MKFYRRIASWILLVVYLPLLVVSSLHIHHETIDNHDNCPQCVGHFEAQHNHQNDCQYCHFLNLCYLVQDAESSAVLLPVIERQTLTACVPTMQLRYGVSLLRAPPIV